MIRLRKGKTNQLAKNQDVILPKLDTGEGQEMDVTVQLKKFAEKKEKKEWLLLVLKRTGKEKEDYECLPTKQ